jgi:hypothetical protein
MLNLFHFRRAGLCGEGSSRLIKPNTSLLTRIFTQAQYEVNEYTPTVHSVVTCKSKGPECVRASGKSFNLSG